MNDEEKDSYKYEKTDSTWELYDEEEWSGGALVDESRLAKCSFDPHEYSKALEGSKVLTKHFQHLVYNYLQDETQENFDRIYKYANLPSGQVEQCTICDIQPSSNKSK